MNAANAATTTPKTKTKRKMSIATTMLSLGLSSFPKEHKTEKINQTDCRADTTAKGFIWANISTSTTSLLQGQSYK